MRILLAVVFISCVLALTNSVNFFTALTHQPQDTVYLGTVHYYEDYFFYLNHFFQGSQGGWLTKNQYTSELTPPSILYWSNVLAGKVGGLVGLPPVMSYNIDLLVTAFTTLLASFFVLQFIFKDATKAFLGFLFTNLATSFMNHIYVDGKPMWYPFQLWRTPHFAFDRLGGVPHQILQTLLFYLLILTYFSKNQKVRWSSVAIVVLLMTINPIPAGLFVAYAWFLQILENRSGTEKRIFSEFTVTKYAIVLVQTLALVVTYFLLQPILNSLPHLQSKIWEAGQQPTTSVPFLLMSIGPIALFYLSGIVPTVKKYGTIGIFTATLPVVCYALFFTKIPQLAGFSNMRIIFPGLYVLLGATSVQGLFFLSRKIQLLFTRYNLPASPKTASRGGQPTTIRTLLISFFLLSSFFTLQWEVRQKTVIASDVKFPFVYMPSDMYQGFEELAKKLPYDDVVLANPTSHIDVLIPALSGHTTYSGHFLTTINNGEKVAKAQKFFSFALLPPEAHTWLTTEKIKYIVVTNFDRNGDQLSKFYPFLQKVIETPSFTTYIVK